MLKFDHSVDKRIRESMNIIKSFFDSPIHKLSEDMRKSEWLDQKYKIANEIVKSVENDIVHQVEQVFDQEDSQQKIVLLTINEKKQNVAASHDFEILYDFVSFLSHINQIVYTLVNISK